ncbi:MAG: hypothetical protein ACKPKO_14180, partial [Candidatus Fonsibacter sp.]
ARALTIRRICQEPSSICHFDTSSRSTNTIYYTDIEECYNKLQEIDEYLVRKEFRLQLFGEKHADKYEYQPIVRTVVDVEGTENFFRPPYAHIKLDLAYNDDSPAFKVYDKKYRVRTEVVLTYCKEALQYIRYKLRITVLSS